MDGQWSTLRDRHGADTCSGLLWATVARLTRLLERFGGQGTNPVNLSRLWSASAAHMNVEANPDMGNDWKEMGKAQVFQCAEWCPSSRFTDPVIKSYQDRARTLPQVEGSIAERPQNELSEILTKKNVLQMSEV